MIGSSTRMPIRVSSDGTSGPDIIVPVDQLDQLRLQEVKRFIESAI